MGRVWTLAAALAVGCIVVYVTVDFMGVTALKFCSAIIGAGAAAAYLPGGNSVSRGLFMLLGVFYGSLSFILGALMFPDTNLGLLLGALTPILAAALTATFTRSPETLLVMLLGAGAMGAIYTGDFFADPQSLNYTLPIALGPGHDPDLAGLPVGRPGQVLRPEGACRGPRRRGSGAGRLGPLSQHQSGHIAGR